MFRRKKKKHQKKLLSDFEKGKVLQVDNGKDNVKYFESIKEKDE